MKAKSGSVNGCGENCSVRFSRKSYGFPDKEKRAKAPELLGSIHISYGDRGSTVVKVL